MFFPVHRQVRLSLGEEHLPPNFSSSNFPRRILDYKRSTWGDSKTALLSKFIYRGNLKSKIVNPKSFDRLGYSNFSVDI